MNEKKPIVVNGFAQNVYRIGTRGGVTAVKVHTPPQKTYVSLEKQMLPNGYVQTLVEKDYPINSASVTSYADGADYRNDPNQAIANAPQRVNLGDITQTQAFLENPQNNARIMSETLGKLKKYYDDMVNAPKVQTVVEKEGEEK